MANENKEPYFLLVFQENDPMPSIISADKIVEMYPYAKDKTVAIVTTDGGDYVFENVESLKMVPAEEINFNM